MIVVIGGVFLDDVAAFEARSLCAVVVVVAILSGRAVVGGDAAVVGGDAVFVCCCRC